MKCARFLYYLISIVLVTSARAGTEVGNGGDAVVCRNNNGKIISAELLDFYEARVKYGFSLKPASTFDENIRLILNRLSEVNQYKVDEYERQINEFMSQTLFISGSELVDIPDSDHLFFPNGCKVEQLAIQVNPRFEYEKRYTINKDIWDHLDEANKAGLCSHEIFYRTRLGQNSVYVRNMNGLLMADRLKDIYGNIFKLAELFAQFRGSYKVVRPEGTLDYKGGGDWVVTNAKNFVIGESVLNGSNFHINVNYQNLAPKKITYLGNEKDGRIAIHIPQPKHFLSDLDIPNWIEFAHKPELPLTDANRLAPQVVFYPEGQIQAIAGWRGEFRQPQMPEGRIGCNSLYIPLIVTKEGALGLCEIEKDSTLRDLEFQIELSGDAYATIQTRLAFSQFNARILVPFNENGKILWNPIVPNDWAQLFIWTGFLDRDISGRPLDPNWQFEFANVKSDFEKRIQFRIGNAEFDLPILEFGRNWINLFEIRFKEPQSLPVGPNLIQFTSIFIDKNRVLGGKLSGTYTEIVNGKSTTYVSELKCPSSFLRPAKKDKIYYSIFFDENGRVKHGHEATDVEDCYK